RLTAAGQESIDGPGQHMLAAAIAAISADAKLLIMTCAEQHLARAVAATGPGGWPATTGYARGAVRIEGDPTDDRSVVHAAAALYAVGALARPQALYAARPSRPFDIWRGPVFLTNPCEASRPEFPESAEFGEAGEFAESAEFGANGRQNGG